MILKKITKIAVTIIIRTVKNLKLFLYSSTVLHKEILPSPWYYHSAETAMLIVL